MKKNLRDIYGFENRKFGERQDWDLLSQEELRKAEEFASKVNPETGKTYFQEQEELLREELERERFFEELKREQEREESMGYLNKEIYDTIRPKEIEELTEEERNDPEFMKEYQETHNEKMNQASSYEAMIKRMAELDAKEHGARTAKRVESYGEQGANFFRSQLDDVLRFREDFKQGQGWNKNKIIDGAAYGYTYFQQPLLWIGAGLGRAGLAAQANVIELFKKGLTKEEKREKSLLQNKINEIEMPILEEKRERGLQDIENFKKKYGLIDKTSIDKIIPASPIERLSDKIILGDDNINSKTLIYSSYFDEENENNYTYDEKRQILATLEHMTDAQDLLEMSIDSKKRKGSKDPGRFHRTKNIYEDSRAAFQYDLDEFFTVGIKGASMGLIASKILEKPEEEWTQIERDYLDSITKLTEIEADVLDPSTTFSYAYGFRETLGFLVSLAASGGMAAITRQGVTAGARGISREIVKKTSKNLSKNLSKAKESFKLSAGEGATQISLKPSKEISKSIRDNVRKSNLSRKRLRAAEKIDTRIGTLQDGTGKLSMRINKTTDAIIQPLFMPSSYGTRFEMELASNLQAVDALSPEMHQFLTQSNPEILRRLGYDSEGNLDSVFGENASLAIASDSIRTAVVKEFNSAIAVSTSELNQLLEKSRNGETTKEEEERIRYLEELIYYAEDNLAKITDENGLPLVNTSNFKAGLEGYRRELTEVVVGKHVGRSIDKVLSPAIGSWANYLGRATGLNRVTAGLRKRSYNRNRGEIGRFTATVGHSTRPSIYVHSLPAEQIEEVIIRLTPSFYENYNDQIDDVFSKHFHYNVLLGSVGLKALTGSKTLALNSINYASGGFKRSAYISENHSTVNLEDGSKVVINKSGKVIEAIGKDGKALTSFKELRLKDRKGRTASIEDNGSIIGQGKGDFEFESDDGRLIQIGKINKDGDIGKRVKVSGKERRNLHRRKMYISSRIDKYAKYQLDVLDGMEDLSALQLQAALTPGTLLSLPDYNQYLAQLRDPKKKEQIEELIDKLTKLESGEKVVENNKELTEEQRQKRIGEIKDILALEKNRTEAQEARQRALRGDSKDVDKNLRVADELERVSLLNMAVQHGVDGTGERFKRILKRHLKKANRKGSTVTYKNQEYIEQSLEALERLEKFEEKYENLPEHHKRLIMSLEAQRILFENNLKNLFKNLDATKSMEEMLKEFSELWGENSNKLALDFESGEYIRGLVPKPLKQFFDTLLDDKNFVENEKGERVFDDEGNPELTLEGVEVFSRIFTSEVDEYLTKNSKENQNRLNSYQVLYDLTRELDGLDTWINYYTNPENYEKINTEFQQERDKKIREAIQEGRAIAEREQFREMLGDDVSVLTAREINEKSLEEAYPARSVEEKKESVGEAVKNASKTFKRNIEQSKEESETTQQTPLEETESQPSETRTEESNKFASTKKGFRTLSKDKKKRGKDKNLNLPPKTKSESTPSKEFDMEAVKRGEEIYNQLGEMYSQPDELTDQQKRDLEAYSEHKKESFSPKRKGESKKKEEDELEEYYAKAVSQLSEKEYNTLVKELQDGLETLFKENGGFIPFRSFVAEYNSSQGLIETSAILPFLIEAWNAAVSKIEGEDLAPELSFRVDNSLVESILSSLYEGDIRSIRKATKNLSKSFSKSKRGFKSSLQRPIQESRNIEDESTGDKVGVVILPGEEQATYEYEGEDPYTPLVNSNQIVSDHLDDEGPVTRVAPGQENLYRGKGLKVGGYLGLEFKRNKDGSYEESYTVNENAYPHLDTRNIQVDENGKPYMEIRFNFGFLLGNLDSDEQFTMGYITHNSEGKEYANSPLAVKENQVNEAPKKKKQTILEYLQDIYGKDKDVEYFRRVLNELITLYENGEDISGHELFQGEAGKEFLKSVPTGSMVNGELVEGGGLPNYYWFNNRSVALYILEDTYQGTKYEFADTEERQERIENGRKHNLEAREKILKGEERFYLDSHKVSGMNLSSDSRNRDHLGRIPEEKKSFNPLSEQFSSKDSGNQGYEKKKEIVDNFRRSATLIYSAHNSINDHLNPDAKTGQIIIDGKVIYDQNDSLNPKYKNIRVEGISKLLGEEGEGREGVITMIYHAGKEVIDGEIIDVYKTMSVVSDHSKNLETDSMNSAQKVREIALELFGNIKYSKLSESERQTALQDFERIFGYPLTQKTSDYNRSANPVFRFKKERKEGDGHGKQETHQKAADFFLGKSKDSESGESSTPKRVLDLSKVKDIRTFFKELSEAQTESEIQKVRDKYSSPYEYAILKNLHSPLVFTEINSGGREKSIFTPAVQYMTMLNHGEEISSFGERSFNQQARSLINSYKEILKESETLNDYQKSRLNEITNLLRVIAEKVNLSPRVIREIREFEKFLSELESGKRTKTKKEREKSPPPIPKKGGENAQGKGGRKKTDEEKKRDNVISIYNKLEKRKTESGNVKIVKNQIGAAGLANAKKAGAIFSLRVDRAFVLGEPVEGHFGNPFTSDQRLAKREGLTQVRDTRTAVLRYIHWVLYSDNVRAEWIRKQIRSGELKGKDIWYYKELGEPSHATALDFLINGEYEIEGTLLDSENFEVKKKAIKEAKKFGQKDLNHSANYIASQVISFLDISKLDKIDKNVLGDYVQKAYYDFIQDLKDRGLDAEAEFLITNQDKLFGLTPENYSGSILEYLQYKLDLNRTVEAEITNFEQIENGSGDHAPGEIYGKRSIELDNKDSISNKIKIFLSNVPDTRKEKLFGDTYDVMTSADALNALHQAIISSDFTFEGVIAVMEVNKRFNKKENGFYEVLIEKFTELKEKHPDLFMQTMFRLSQVSNQMRMVLHSFNNSNKKINLEVLDPNSRDPKFLKRKIWTEQLKKSEVIEFYEGNKYKVNRKKLQQIKDFYGDIKNNLKDVGIDSDFNRENLENFFLDLGLSFSDKIIDLLYEDPERSGSDLGMSIKLINELLRGSKSAISNIIKNLEKVKDSSEKGYVFEPTEDQVASKSIIRLNPLTFDNSRINEVIVLDNMTIFESMATVYTGGKTVQSAQNFSEAFVKLQAIQNSLKDFAETGELTGYLASREAEAITSHSHLINMIKSNPESLKDYLNIVGDALEAFKKKGDKVSENNGITDLNELDHFAMTLGLFLKNEGKIDKGIAIDNFHGLSLRKGYSPFPTISDSDHIPFLQTLLVEFNAGQFNLEERYLEKKALKYLRDSLIKGELKRIAEYIIKIQNQGERVGVKYYDEGALWINSLFQMNGVLLDVGTTDSEGNTITEKRPLNNAFREQVVNAIQSDPSVMVILQNLQEMDSPEAHSEMNAKLEEIVDKFIENHEIRINEEIHDIYFKEVEKAKEEIEKLRKQFEANPDSPFSGVNKDVNQIAGEFAYNNMLNFNDIYNLFNNDKAFYFKTKALNRSGEIGIARIDLQDIERNGLFIFSAKELIEHYLPKEDATLLLRRIRQAFGKEIHSDELTVKERNAILEEFPILRYSREIGTIDYTVGEMIEATHELYMKKMSQIAKDLDENETKRIKKQTSPGLKFLDPQFRKKKYRQVILKDIEDPSKHLEYYASLNGKVTDEHRQSFEIISNYELNDNPTKEEKKEYSDALANIERSFPGIADYLKTAKTDAQERTTWREHLDLLYYMGIEGFTTEVYSEVRAKLERQSESLRRGERIREVDKLTEEEKKIVVFQPMKPLATGDVMENHHGMIINRAIYIKSSAYPLIPELTEAFPELNAQRMMLEHIQEETGENVRLAYDSAVKVGGTENSAHSLDTYTPITSEHYRDAYERVLESSVQLDRENFYYQMDVPYNPERDQITLMTQFEKILLGDGISHITEDVFDSMHFDPSLLKEVGIDPKKKKISGVEMQRVVNNIYKRDQKRRTENLMRRLGIERFEDLNEGKPEIVENIAREIRAQLDRKHDKESVKVLYESLEIEDGRYVKKYLTEEEYRKSGKKAIKASLTIPLHLNPNSYKMEAVLNSIVNKNNVRLTMSGFSFVVGSEEGFDFRRYSEEALKDLKGKGLILTDFFDPEKGLQRNQVFMTNVLTFMDPDTGKIEKIDLKEYIGEDGILRLKEGDLPQHAFELFTARIPTSAHQSGISVQIAGFLPDHMGDLMIVSKDSTIQIGEDYDVDKRYGYKYNMIQDPTTGKISPINEAVIENLKNRVEWFRKDKKESLKDLEKRYQEKRDELFKRYFLSLKEKGKKGGRKFLELVSSGGKNILFTLSELKLAQESLEKLEQKKRNNESLDGMWFEKALVQLDLFENTNQEAQDIGNEAENQEPSHNLLKYRIRELERRLGLEGETWREDIENPNYEERKMLWEEYHKYLNFLNDELFSKKGELFQAYSDYVNMRYISILESKADQNNLISAYKSVMETSDPEVQQNISSILSTEFTGKTANAIHDKVTKSEGVYHSLSYFAQRDKMRAGAGGKHGISVHSNFVTFSSVMQQARGKLVFNYKNEVITANNKLGLFKDYEGSFGRVRDQNGVRISSYLMSNQNTAMDNQNLGYMHKRNENRHTMGAMVAMQMAGYENDGLQVVADNGTIIGEMSYSSLFISQPIIRDFADIREKLLGNLEKKFLSLKDIVEAVIADYIRKSDLDQYYLKDDGGQIALDKYGIPILKPSKDREVRKILNSQFLYNSLDLEAHSELAEMVVGKIDHSDPEAVNDLYEEGINSFTITKNYSDSEIEFPEGMSFGDIQLVVLRDFLKFREQSQVISELQRFMNIEGSGLGKSFYDVLQRKNFLIDLATRKFERENNVIIKLGDNQKPISLMENYIGKPHFVNQEKRDQFEKDHPDAIFIADLSENEAREVDYLSDNRNYTSLYITPTTREGHKIVNAISLAYNLWSPLFPYDHEAMYIQMKQLENLFNVNEFNKEEFFHRVTESFRDYTYSNLPTLSRGSYQETVSDLFFDDSLAQRESLASYILRLKELKDENGNSIAPELINSRLIRNLSFSISNSESPSLIIYSDNKMSPEENLKMYNELDSLINSEVTLPDRNGREMTVALLMKDLLSYSFIASQERGAVGFRNVLPISLFKKYGVDELLRNRGKIDSYSGRVLVEGYLGRIRSVLNATDSELRKGKVSLKNVKRRDVENLISNFGIILKTYGEDGENLFRIEGDYLIFPPEKFLEDNFGNFITQFVQHNYNLLPAVYPRKGGIYSFLLNKKVQQGIASGEWRQFEVPRKMNKITGNPHPSPPFVKIVLDNTSSLFMLVEENDLKARYIKIDKAGGYGFNEYQAFTNRIDSRIVENKSDTALTAKKQILTLMKNAMSANNKEVNFKHLVQGMMENKRFKYQPIWKAFGSLIPALDSIEFEIVDDLRGAASYSVDATNTPKIKMDRESLEQNNYSFEYISDVLTEEIFHHFTRTVFDPYVRFKGFKKDGSLDYTLLQEDIPTDLKNLLELYEQGVRAIAEKHPEIYDIANNFHADKRDSSKSLEVTGELEMIGYRASDMHEFIVGMFQDASIMEILANTKADKTNIKDTKSSLLQTIWEKILNLVQYLLPENRVEDSIAENFYKNLHSFAYSRKAEVARNIKVQNFGTLEGEMERVKKLYDLKRGYIYDQETVEFMGLILDVESGEYSFDPKKSFDEGDNKIISVEDRLNTITPKKGLNPFLAAKDKAKIMRATSGYIGKGLEGSSTHHYAKEFAEKGFPVNPNNFEKGGYYFASVQGGTLTKEKEINRADTLATIIKALNAGAFVILDGDPDIIFSGHNKEGEGFIKTKLEKIVDKDGNNIYVAEQVFDEKLNTIYNIWKKAEPKKGIIDRLKGDTVGKYKDLINLGYTFEETMYAYNILDKDGNVVKELGMVGELASAINEIYNKEFSEDDSSNSESFEITLHEKEDYSLNTKTFEVTRILRTTGEKKIVPSDNKKYREVLVEYADKMGGEVFPIISIDHNGGKRTLRYVEINGKIYSMDTQNKNEVTQKGIIKRIEARKKEMGIQEGILPPKIPSRVEAVRKAKEDGKKAFVPKGEEHYVLEDKESGRVYRLERVTTYVGNTVEYKSKDSVVNLKNSTVVGNFYDIAGRVLFNNPNATFEDFHRELQGSESFEQMKHFDKETLFNEFKKDVRKIKKEIENLLGDENLIFHTEEMFIYELKENKDYDGVGGTTDLIVEDSSGRIHIFDFKTVFDNKGVTRESLDRKYEGESKIDSWTRQQKEYAEMYGAKLGYVPNNYIITFPVHYERDQSFEGDFNKKEDREAWKPEPRQAGQSNKSQPFVFQLIDNSKTPVRKTKKSIKEVRISELERDLVPSKEKIDPKGNVSQQISEIFSRVDKYEGRENINVQPLLYDLAKIEEDHSTGQILVSSEDSIVGLSSQAAQLLDRSYYPSIIAPIVKNIAKKVLEKRNLNPEEIYRELNLSSKMDNYFKNESGNSTILSLIKSIVNLTKNQLERNPDVEIFSGEPIKTIYNGLFQGELKDLLKGSEIRVYKINPDLVFLDKRGGKVSASIFNFHVDKEYNLNAAAAKSLIFEKVLTSSTNIEVFENNTIILNEKLERFQGKETIVNMKESFRPHNNLLDKNLSELREPSSKERVEFTSNFIEQALNNVEVSNFKC